MPNIPGKILNIIGNILILLGVVFLLLSYGPVVIDEVWYWYKEQKVQDISIDDEGGVEDSVFARLIANKPILIRPVNTDFSIVIEKLGVSAPIVADVSVTDEKVYKEALKIGAAHAISSDVPSEKPGNVYLFAHSALDFWNFGKYAKVFNLLRKLESGDNVHVFYKGVDYVYSVVGSEIYNGWNTYPLTRTTIESILTLQTCDPPGTTINRLVVTAKLSEVRKVE